MYQIELVATRPIWAKGKGLPKKGVQIVKIGDNVKLERDSFGWFIVANYKNIIIRVATLPHTI